MVKRLALLGVGVAIITCPPTVLGASNQSITAADIDEVEAIAYRVCAPFVRQGVEGQDPQRSIKFRIKAVDANCVHVEAFRILANPFDIHFMACKHEGKWQIEPAHLTWRHDK
jgi:hypothetical protein